ncbi:MAG: CHAD domain-containing protein [Candidatus Deferrimicrobiaceae bacterium]
MKSPFPENLDEQPLIRGLAGRYSIRKERTTSRRFSLFDTFDWRLFRRSLVLVASGNQMVLRKPQEKAILHSVEVSSPPVFSSDLPDGDLKEKLAPIVTVRALEKLAEVDTRSTTYRLLSRDGKIVARLVCEESRLAGDDERPAFWTSFRLRPVRGAAGSFPTVRKRWEKDGSPRGKNGNIYGEALKAAGRNPGDYSTRVTIPSDPRMRSDEAAKIILRFLLQVIRINEARLAEDRDTEFLHDYRVAIRRTRSALRQMKQVFPAEVTRRFRKDFAFVGKLSNDLRDLDVHLQNEGIYKAMLPPAQRDDIGPLFDYLREKRAQVFRDFLPRLEARRYRKIIQDWDLFLNGPGNDFPDSPNAELPVRELARKRIYKKYRRILKICNVKLESQAGDMLHLLRIECKELRYLLEFFSPLFPREKIHDLIGQLKELQDLLGEYNDFRVQQQRLQDLAGELPWNDSRSKKTVAAIGSLVKTMEREKRKAKKALAKTFSDYASIPKQKVYRELFGAGSSPV